MSVLIQRPNWEKSSFGVVIKSPPMSILKPTGATLHDGTANSSALEPESSAIAYRPGAEETNFMQILLFIWRIIVNLVKQIWLLPKTISLALQQRQRQITRHQFEIERLDRIRNPSKYAGR